MKNILVTGANGFLGSNTINELLIHGYYVKGFLRDSNKYYGEVSNNLELIEGDIKNVNDLNTALFNCDCVIHTAAITDQNLLNYDDYYEVNVKGVINVTKAAIKNKVNRIIYVSTANEFGYGSLENLGDETREMSYPFNKLFYSKSKKAAHDFLLTKLSQIEVIIVNPTFMIGAYDTKPSSGKIVLMGLRNRFVICPSGGKNFVWVKDVSIGIINAMKNGINGEAYLLANENLNFYDFFNLLRENTENNFKIIRLPNSLLMLLGQTGSILRKFGVRTNFSMESMKALSVNNYYSNEKAKRELRIDFQPIEYGIKEAVSWFLKKPN